MMRAMELAELQSRIRRFAAERHWEPYHTPKNLTMALAVEVAELMELYQWRTPEESRTFGADPARREQVADEIADVLIYLMQLADATGVDVAQAVTAKMAKNALKHPVGKPVT
jgi:NTP pyrophosphatase (non-canonical NTP hydrolase)